MVRLAARRHASATPRTRRRSTRTSSTSHFYGEAFPSLWHRAARRRAVLGRAQGVKIFRVDNPHTKPFPFWEWLIARRAGAPSRRDLPRRGLHAAEDHGAAGQARLHAVLHLLHLAQHQARADRLSDRADAGPVRATSCGRTSSSTRRTSIPTTCRPAAAPASGCALVLAATLGGNYGIYSGFELCEAARRFPARRSISTPRSIELKAWDWERPGNIREDIRRSTRCGAPSPALAAVRQPQVLQRLERPHPLLRQSDAGPQRLPAVRRQSRSAPSPKAPTSRCRCGSSDSPTMRRSRSRTW